MESIFEFCYKFQTNQNMLFLAKEEDTEDNIFEGSFQKSNLCF